MTRDALASIAALHSEVPWHVCEACDDPWPCATRKLADEGLNLNGRIGAKQKDWADARAIVVAVNLAEPLWRVAEAARAYVATSDESPYTARGAWDALRAALAGLDAEVKETK